MSGDIRAYTVTQTKNGIQISTLGVERSSVDTHRYTHRPGVWRLEWRWVCVAEVVNEPRLVAHLPSKRVVLKARGRSQLILTGDLMERL